MAMAGKCYAFVFLTLCGVLCVSALEEGGNGMEKEEVKVIGVDKLIRLPSDNKEKRTEEIPREQSPIETHSFRVPKWPMVGEDEKEHHRSFEEGRFRPMRFRFGRPGGCHGKFRHFVMPREDRSHPMFLRRMGRHRHAHAQPYWFPAMEDLRRDDGKASSTAFHAHLNREKEADMGFEREAGMGVVKQSGQREREPEKGFGEKEEEERVAVWKAWLRSMFN